MTFPHGTSGTCRIGCEKFGRCHCGCFYETRRAVGHQRRRDIVRGMPFIWARGHNPHHGGGSYIRSGVPVDRILPLAVWLRGRYGSYRKAAAVIGVSPNTLTHITAAQRKRVSPQLARRITEAVLAHRFSADPWRWLSEPTRLPTPEDQRRASNPERERATQLRRELRAGRPPMIQREAAS